MSRCGSYHFFLSAPLSNFHDFIFFLLLLLVSTLNRTNLKSCFKSPADCDHLPLVPRYATIAHLWLQLCVQCGMNILVNMLVLSFLKNVMHMFRISKRITFYPKPDLKNTTIVSKDSSPFCKVHTCAVSGLADADVACGAKGSAFIPKSWEHSGQPESPATIKACSFCVRLLMKNSHQNPTKLPTAL